MNRQSLCTWANEVKRLSRKGGAPTLSPESSRATLLRWLQWNDENGSFTDDSRDSDDEPLTLEDAWDQLELAREQE